VEAEKRLLESERRCYSDSGSRKEVARVRMEVYSDSGSRKEGARVRIEVLFGQRKQQKGSKSPFLKVGKMVLNKNPENYFNEVEQAAFGTVVLLMG
jgi:catalase